MRSLSTSNKRSTDEFAQEMDFLARKTRRGGQTLKAVAIQSKPAPQTTSEPPPSSTIGPLLSRPPSPSQMLVDDNDWNDDTHGKRTGPTRRNPGQVFSCSYPSLTHILQLYFYRQEMIS
jgi:hypothetical protein